MCVFGSLWWFNTWLYISFSPSEERKLVRRTNCQEKCDFNFSLSSGLDFYEKLEISEWINIKMYSCFSFVLMLTPSFFLSPSFLPSVLFVTSSLPQVYLPSFNSLCFFSCFLPLFVILLIMFPHSLVPSVSLLSFYPCVTASSFCS